MVELLPAYEVLVNAADQAFIKMQREYGAAIKCARRCTDCCYAVFGLFLIEAAYLKYHFDMLDESIRMEILRRAAQAAEELRLIQKRLNYYTDDPVMQGYALSRQRVRCPLLTEEDECALYPYRPITCRVYGIPVAVQGRARVCWKAGFERGKQYPTFNLDVAYKELYRLSQLLLGSSGREDAAERAAVLISVPKALTTPLEALMKGEIE